MDKEKVKEYGFLLTLFLGIIGVGSFVGKFVGLEDWLLLVPLTIVVTELIWWAIDEKPEPGKEINCLKCSACGEEFDNPQEFKEAMKTHWCEELEKDKHVSCKPVAETKTIEGESVFWFTAKWKVFLLFLSTFVAGGVLSSKKLYDVYWKEANIGIVVLACLFVLIWFLFIG